MPEIIVWDEPRGQQRHRTAGGHQYTPSATLEAQRRIREVWSEAGFGRCPGPVSVTVTAYLARPKHHFGTGRNAGVIRPAAPAYPTGKPDIDNLLKLALDALARVAFEDDAAVVDALVRKEYAQPSEAPHWAIWIVSQPAPREDR